MTEDRYYFKVKGTWWWADEPTTVWHGEGSDTWIKPEGVTPKKWEGEPAPPQGKDTGLKCCCGTEHFDLEGCPFCGRDIGHLEATKSNWWRGCCGEIKIADKEDA